jgi:taurine dioxygenase
VDQPLKVAGHPEMFVLESDGERPFVAERWHTDVTFEPEPPMASILRAIEVPEAGGDTLWASMYAAYDALSDRMQHLLSDLRALHGPGNYALSIASEQERRRFEERPPVVHPVVRTHPVTGRKGIFVNPVFTERIEGMKDAESQSLLTFLYDHVASPEFHCRFHWTPGAVAIWDNRITQHRVVADRPEARRVMHRITLAGDKPF